MALSKSTSPVLTGKVAFVTGGSRGFGPASELRLAVDGDALAVSNASCGAPADQLLRSIAA
jgi:3-oxoacyl-[acyl-carrier protein] reductase